MVIMSYHEFSDITILANFCTIKATKICYALRSVDPEVPISTSGFAGMKTNAGNTRLESQSSRPCRHIPPLHMLVKKCDNCKTKSRAATKRSFLSDCSGSLVFEIFCLSRMAVRSRSLAGRRELLRKTVGFQPRAQGEAAATPGFPPGSPGNAFPLDRLENALVVVKPETLIRWHRGASRFYGFGILPHVRGSSSSVWGSFSPNT